MSVVGRSVLLVLLAITTFSSFTISAQIPDWYVSPPSDSASEYIIAAEGMTQELAIKKATSQLSQRFLTAISSESSYQSNKVNNKTVSEFKERVSSKGFSANFPAPKILNKQVDKQIHSFYGLFSFNKQEVKRALVAQYQSLALELSSVVADATYSPFKCSVNEIKQQDQLATFEQLTSVIKTNWVSESTQEADTLFNTLEQCFQNRRLMLVMPAGYLSVDTHIKQMIADWNASIVPASAAMLTVAVNKKEFTRFGQKGIKLETTVQLVENGDAIISEQLSVSGYNPKSADKALANAQKKLNKQLTIKIKQQLRSK